MDVLCVWRLQYTDRLRSQGSSATDLEALAEISKVVSTPASDDANESQAPFEKHLRLYVAWLAEHHLLPRIAPDLVLDSGRAETSEADVLRAMPPFQMRSTFSTGSVTVTGSTSSSSSSTTPLLDSLWPLSTPIVRCAALIVFGIGQLRRDDGKQQGLRCLARAAHLYPDSGLPMSALSREGLDNGSCRAQLTAFLSNVRALGWE